MRCCERADSGLASSGEAPVSYLRWLSNCPWLQGSRDPSAPQTSVGWRNRAWEWDRGERRGRPGTRREWEGVSEAAVLAMQAWLLVDARSLCLFFVFKKKAYTEQVFFVGKTPRIKNLLSISVPEYLLPYWLRG